MANKLQRVAAKLTGKCDIANVIVIRPAFRTHLTTVGRMMTRINLQKPVVRDISNFPIDFQIIGFIVRIFFVFGIRVKTTYKKNKILMFFCSYCYRVTSLRLHVRCG